MLILRFLFLCVVSCVLAEDLVIIKQGQISGRRLRSRRGREIYAFQGIPYAKPPLGELRFKPPQPVEPWKGVLNTVTDVPLCLQKGLFLGDEVFGEEDCLYLNVYTPKMGNLKPLDVMVWIHGGGWQSGSGNSLFYGPEFLLDKDVILVTINYRLGPLGFLSTGDEVCPGNNGLKDQVLALRWIQDNIEAFGGNPNSVTIFGESAGGASVHYHMMSSVSKGLFHRAISQSGTALCLWAHSPNKTTRYQAEKLAVQLGCPTEPSEELVSCLREKDGRQMTDLLSTFLEWNIDPMIPFKPVVETHVGPDDEAFIKEEPLDVLLSPHTQDLVPWMVGFLSADGGIVSSSVYGTKGLLGELNDNFDTIIPMAMYFRETAPKSEQKSIAQKIKEFYFQNKQICKKNKQGLTDMYTDSFFLAGINSAVKLHSQREAPVYYFYFDYRGTNSFSTLFGDPETDYGPVHLDELIYLFPQNHSFPGVQLSTQDEQMIDTMTTLWTNFAKTGNPTPESSNFDTWNPVSSPDTFDYAHIKHDGLKMGQHLLKERTDFWSKLPHKARIPDDVKDEL